jgi:hypothetical protein
MVSGRLGMLSDRSFAWAARTECGSFPLGRPRRAACVGVATSQGGDGRGGSSSGWTGSAVRAIGGGDGGEVLGGADRTNAAVESEARRRAGRPAAVGAGRARRVRARRGPRGDRPVGDGHGAGGLSGGGRTDAMRVRHAVAPRSRAEDPGASAGRPVDLAHLAVLRAAPPRERPVGGRGGLVPARPVCGIGAIRLRQGVQPGLGIARGASGGAPHVVPERRRRTGP